MTLKTLFVPAHLANRTAHYLREIGWTTITEAEMRDAFAINIDDDPEFLSDCANALTLANQDVQGTMDPARS